MASVKSSMRLKINDDTFFLPNSDGGVYFRNNRVSFRLEGKTIYQWIEKLLPMFNGEYSLEELTDGLTEAYRDRVYEIADRLYQNGFVRDVSQDRPHQLPAAILQNYAAQLAYLDSVSGSGAYRFQTYRQTKVLAVGSGAFLSALASALFESGLPRFHVLLTTSTPQTSRRRLAELAAHASRTDPEAALEEVVLYKRGMSGWQEAIEPFDAVLYVSEEGNVEELRVLHAACKEAGKMLLPALCCQQAGLAGPLVHGEDEGDWESAWRRIHQTALQKDPEQHIFSSTAGAMLANVLVFECMKRFAGITESETNSRMFLLDLETLEGNWHPFLPHPLVTEGTEIEEVRDFEQRLRPSSGNIRSIAELFSCFSRLTSEVTGVFHVWDEGDLKQLPLSLCRVQAVDPLSEGPAGLLPDIVCAGLTHQEARREAGLAGVETYALRLASISMTSFPAAENMGVGAGESFAEGVCRGLQKWLNKELESRQSNGKHAAARVEGISIDDERCRYFWQSLAALRGAPVIGLGEEISGFPVMWVGSRGRWFGSAGLNLTLALRDALQQALRDVQYETAIPSPHRADVASVQLEGNVPHHVMIPKQEEAEHSKALEAALQVLRQNRKRPVILDLSIEPFMKEELAGVYGVWLEEESR
ncbi:putative thiazole-containing bacteriocin maturation protein [Paenibacillus sp. UNCCL117]|uniref:putative thiazole-containing bacteriocin maturation protein n=1 Tax=unclassified Paenibacillus TaxID=185978 RepID=UPI00088A24F8|nr:MULTISPECIES: putative thiazole-containing bacteriocin maturation protein [unclassified Paenibacillus]SDC12019.1 putative thiazole-containing bacteriocin maturation protein [Paenibacillus sp. cl123]SFW16732.1 putative thiazole-containing bacteriocin maturation protein [Paenibacillus sp. UNCCL117]